MTRNRQSQPTPPRRPRKLLLPVLGVAVVAVLAVAVVVAISKPFKSPPPLVTPVPPPFASGTSKGQPSAPLTIVEYSDFQ